MAEANSFIVRTFHRRGGADFRRGNCLERLFCSLRESVGNLLCNQSYLAQLARDLALCATICLFILLDVRALRQFECTCHACSHEASDYYSCLIESPCSEDVDEVGRQVYDRPSCCQPPGRSCRHRPAYLTGDDTRRRRIIMQGSAVVSVQLNTPGAAPVELPLEISNSNLTHSTALLALLSELRC